MDFYLKLTYSSAKKIELPSFSTQGTLYEDVEINHFYEKNADNA